MLVGISIIRFLYSLVAMSSRTERFIEQLMEEEGRKDTDEQDMKQILRKGRRDRNMNNKLEVIGIDHGWSMMKTISQVFVTGVKEITNNPALFGDVLEYEGKFYKVGTVRQEVIHVTFMLDEFANVALPDDYCSLLVLCEAVRFQVLSSFRNFAQLKALFKDTLGNHSRQLRYFHLS